MGGDDVRRMVDVESWARREHFQFFSAFEDPFHGICVRVDCTAAYTAAKRMRCSFYLYYLYQSLAAAQCVENFRYRIVDGEVFLYDHINAGSTIARSDGTFGLGKMPYRETLEEFLVSANAEMERVRGGTGLGRPNDVNLIRYSALPWLDFTSLSHARQFSMPDSCPRISFGKMTDTAGRRSMPVSIHVHHALVDGLHVGQFVEAFQERMNAA
jgi:chloramphenicol O-acetyltransferase type A